MCAPASGFHKWVLGCKLKSLVFVKCFIVLTIFTYLLTVLHVFSCGAPWEAAVPFRQQALASRKRSLCSEGQWSATVTANSILSSAMRISCPCDSHEVTTLIISVFEVLRNLVAQDPTANKVTKQIVKLKSSHLLIPLSCVLSASTVCCRNWGFRSKRWWVHHQHHLKDLLA